MAQKNDNLDRLLYQALQPQPLPSRQAEELKEKMRCQVQNTTKKKTISLWYIPLVCSLILSVFFWAAAAVLWKGSPMYIFVVAFICFCEGAQVLLTFVGLRRFNLKRGAEWERCYYL